MPSAALMASMVVQGPESPSKIGIPRVLAHLRTAAAVLLPLILRSSSRLTIWGWLLIYTRPCLISSVRESVRDVALWRHAVGLADRMHPFSIRFRSLDPL